jgi:hypothetical protein
MADSSARCPTAIPESRNATFRARYRGTVEPGFALPAGTFGALNVNNYIGEPGSTLALHTAGEPHRGSHQIQDHRAGALARPYEARTCDGSLLRTRNVHLLSRISTAACARRGSVSLERQRPARLLETAYARLGRGGGSYPRPLDSPKWLCHRLPQATFVD